MMIIFGIIGAVMSNSKKNDQKPMPPFNNKPNTTSFEQYPHSKMEPEKTKTTVKTLEDFAKEVFEQLNEKNKEPQEVFREPDYKKDAVEPTIQTEPILSHSNSTLPKNGRESRPALDEGRSSKKRNEIVNEDVIKQTEIGSFVPTSKQALIQAIITSEIIAPPKAKQR
nr:hypothetical protein [Lysinibacillus timonensis]